MTLPVVYARLSQATMFVSPDRRLVPFVLAKCQPGAGIAQVSRRITEQTGLQAMSQDDFSWLTMRYYLEHTGIPLNFGATVLLAFLVGYAMAGQTFYLFTVENLKQFGTLKAMGLSDRRLIGMILVQALLVGLIGYGLGVGLASLFGTLAQKSLPLLAFFLPWQVIAASGIFVMLITVLSSLLSIRRVLVVEPAVVFG
jgi:putative ABC transport system permease protein